MMGSCALSVLGARICNVSCSAYVHANCGDDLGSIAFSSVLRLCVGDAQLRGTPEKSVDCAVMFDPEVPSFRGSCRSYPSRQSYQCAGFWQPVRIHGIRPRDPAEAPLM